MHVEPPPRISVLIVGAGPAGLGCAAALQDAGVTSVWVAERHEIGASFRRWPDSTRFITPSFYSNAFNLPDLNGITSDCSPANLLHTEHPSGKEYAAYLRHVVAVRGLSVIEQTEVLGIEPNREEGFLVTTPMRRFQAGFVIWACGEFQFPLRAGFQGAHLCVHYADAPALSKGNGAPALVIGGGESGVDLACTLIEQGWAVHVADGNGRWEETQGDPSDVLAPVTRQRLQCALATGRLQMHPSTRILAVREHEAGYVAFGEDGEKWFTPEPPFDCSGFGHNLTPIREHFAWDRAGRPVLTYEDESTLEPGLFLAGPMLRGQDAPLCYIYKFRQRFPIVAEAIRRRIELRDASQDESARRRTNQPQRLEKKTA